MEGGKIDISPSKIYVGKADIRAGGERPEDLGRVKNIAVAANAAVTVNESYGGIKDPKIKQTKIDNYLDLQKRVGRGVDPLHRSAAKDVYHEALSQRDSLTGLLNNAAINAELEEAFRGNIPIGILRADLDKFSWLNDTLGGHEMGDLYLQIVSAHLRRETQSTDFAGRPGGDEFIVLLKNVTSRNDFFRVAERLFAAIEGKQMLHETLGVFFHSQEQKVLPNGQLEYRRTIALREICTKLLDLHDDVIVNHDTGESAQSFFMKNMRGSTKQQFLENVNGLDPELLNEMREYNEDKRISDDIGHEAVHREHFEDRFINVLEKLIPEMGVSMSGIWMENPQKQHVGDVSRRLDASVYQIKEHGGNRLSFIID